VAYEVELCYNYYSNRGDIVMYLESVPVLSAQVGGGHVFVGLSLRKEE